MTRLSPQRSTGSRRRGKDSRRKRTAPLQGPARRAQPRAPHRPQAMPTGMGTATGMAMAMATGMAMAAGMGTAVAAEEPAALAPAAAAQGLELAPSQAQRSLSRGHRAPARS